MGGFCRPIHHYHRPDAPRPAPPLKRARRKNFRSPEKGPPACCWFRNMLPPPEKNKRPHTARGARHALLARAHSHHRKEPTDDDNIDPCCRSLRECKMSCAPLLHLGHRIARSLVSASRSPRSPSPMTTRKSCECQYRGQSLETPLFRAVGLSIVTTSPISSAALPSCACLT